MAGTTQPGTTGFCQTGHVPVSLVSVACALLVFLEALRLVILPAAQMPLSPNT